MLDVFIVPCLREKPKTRKRQPEKPRHIKDDKNCTYLITFLCLAQDSNIESKRGGIPHNRSGPQTNSLIKMFFDAY